MPKTIAAVPARSKKVPRETPSIQSLDRGLVILEAVARSKDSISLGQLTAILGIDRSSVFRLANTLKRRGYLANPSVGKDYILGASVWRLSRNYDWSNMLASIAHEQLKALALTTNETAHLAVREGRNGLFVDHVACSQVIAVSGQTGELVPLYCTSHGKALIADFTLDELKALYGSRSLQAHTTRTITSVTELARQCEEIRKNGYATDDAELQEGVRCVAAPIRDRDGAIIGSIGISAPLIRFPEERYAHVAPQVTAVARQIGNLINPD
ncbi:MAG TPA: IclR family transcriptional regulator [Bryobacteraceae bacterium]|nr:IclR family transcriptional regulator [Bryobacteraceae bacterium]